MKSKIYSGLVALGLIFGAVSGAVSAPEMSALELAKAGDKYVGVQAQDRVVQIRSDKSVGSLTPSVWYVVYYDPTATMKASEVKFGGGQMMEVKRPVRLLEPFSGGNKEMNMKKVKIDSNRALDIARKEPLLNNLDLRASQFWLGLTDNEATWKVRLWASKLNQPDKMAEIGDLYISAHTGEVVKNALHINSVQ
ncbi:MAG TPA: hypothetical protein VFC44_03745 [Candidatus Saccharimonadales bacterium]|nr:hypothetical protein [Candidatus Saccharimonadales bacterium]